MILRKKRRRNSSSLTGKDESIDSFIWSKTGDSLFYMRVDYDSKISKLCRYDFQAENCYPIDIERSLGGDSGQWRRQVAAQDTSRLRASQFLYVYDFTSKQTDFRLMKRTTVRKAFLCSVTEFFGRAKAATKIAKKSRAFFR